MARYLLLALNGPTSGENDEAAYNSWYDEVHVPDLKAVSGITSARRFKIVQSKGADWPYVAAYEIETDDLAKTMAEMSTKPRPFPPSFDRENSGHVLAIELESWGLAAPQPASAAAGSAADALGSGVGHLHYHLADVGVAGE